MNKLLYIRQSVNMSLDIKSHREHETVQTAPSLTSNHRAAFPLTERGRVLLAVAVFGSLKDEV